MEDIFKNMQVELPEMETNEWDEKPWDDGLMKSQWDDGINNSLDTAEKKISELEDMKLEIV